MIRALWAAATIFVSVAASGNDVLGYDAMIFRQGMNQRHASLSDDVLARVEAEYAADPKLENALSLAQIRILQRRADESLQLLAPFEEEEGGNPQLASTLVLAYEHLGRDEDALDWVQVLVRRGGDDHYESEWLHAKIIEAKITLKSDPRWLDANTVMGVDFGEAAEPGPPDLSDLGPAGRQMVSQDLYRALGTQIYERKAYFPTPDPILADLHQAFADVVALKGWAVNDPVWHYRCALEYGSPREGLLKARMENFSAAHAPVTDPKMNINLDPDTGKPKPCRPDFKEPRNWNTLAICIASALTIIGFLVMRRKHAS